VPLYFAYGSNLDRGAMTARCPGSAPVGPARLARHRLVIMREGYASVIRDPRREVRGLLWRLALADVPALDRYESVASGLYVKRQVPVLTASGPRLATLYIGRNAGPGVPRPGYLEAVLAAARELGLPAAYLAGIAALGRTGRSAGEDSAPAGPVVRPTRRSPRDASRPPEPRGWTWSP
jgi:hypothetical protein